MADRPSDLDMRSMMPPKSELHAQIDGWLAEDIGRLDITTEFLIPADAKAEFVINTRDDIVLCGMDIAAEVFRHHVPECNFEIMMQDGAHAAPGSTLGRVRGPARGLLTAERTALNLLQLLTGIATLTSKYAALVEGSGATLIDTRKTIPGYRALSKYAACVGGARNHRIRLDDGMLIKDNHIAVCGGIGPAMARAKALTPSLTKIEVECDTLEQVAEAADQGADVILLDNMDASVMTEAARIVAGRSELEASGGVNLDTIHDKARSGVDYISVGRMTQSAPAADIGLDVSIMTD
jgi:nicotinate-nucleotide pyrophosphorylase (carboxylating)